MMVMSFPLLVRAARVAFEEVDPRLEQIARTLGAHEPRVFLTITLPLASARHPQRDAARVRARDRRVRRDHARRRQHPRPHARRSRSRSTTSCNSDATIRPIACSLSPSSSRSPQSGSPRLSLRRRGMSVVLRDVVLPLAHFTLDVSVEMHARTTALSDHQEPAKRRVLEIIAGLRQPQSGSIAFNGIDVTRPSAATAPRRLRPAGRRALSAHVRAAERLLRRARRRTCSHRRPRDRARSSIAT